MRAESTGPRECALDDSAPPATNWPVGQNFDSHVGQISGVTLPVSPGKGRIASRHELCGGMRWTRQRRARKGSQGGFAVSGRPVRRRTMLPTVFARTLLGPRVPVERSAEMGADGEVVWSGAPSWRQVPGDASGPTGFWVHRQSRGDGG